MYGFYRIATCTPMLRVGDVAYNFSQIVDLAQQANARSAAVAVFPELALTGSTCGDLFYNSTLLSAVERHVRELVATLPGGTLYVVGAPMLVRGRLYNTAIVIQDQSIVCVVPKSHLADCRESDEGRWFSSGRGHQNVDIPGVHQLVDVVGELISYAGVSDIPFGTDVIVDVDGLLRLGVEIGYDLWSVVPPSSNLALGGATLIVNPAASNEIVGRAAYRRELVRNQSARCVCAYAYASAGVFESTTDCVYGGHQLVAENGELLLEGERFQRNSVLNLVDVDLERIATARLMWTSFRHEDDLSSGYRRIAAAPVPEPTDCVREFSRQPFIPGDVSEREERCQEILSIQVAGLAKRLEHTHSQTLVLGISGGLDSTLALLVCWETLKLLGRPSTELIAVTMPGFGTTDRTYLNAVGLCRELGVTLLEISIKDACLEHFRNIGHDVANHNVVYENSQARERTQILLDIANQRNGLAVGTGDLSESVLGWCTYNGDHISMYGVNGTVPKTLMRYVIEWVGKRSTDTVRTILRDIIDTPISPELLPADDNGTIKQKTEDVIGPYEVHDFFLYHFMGRGASPEKILFVAEQTFAGTFEHDKLKQFLNVFMRRFFTQQFKRSCLPDGPKVGSIGLSPRGDWRMPSDMCGDLWREMTK